MPQQLTRSMAREAEASRESDAKVVSASGELNASYALNQAANGFGSSSTAIQLRYLQTLTRKFCLFRLIILRFASFMECK